MIQEITNNIDKIIEACREFRLQSLYVFGSAARESDFTPKSDIDFLVTFKTNPLLENIDELSLYFESIDKLSNKFSNILKRDIDLLIEKNIKNKYLLESINSEKKIIYAEA